MTVVEPKICEHCEHGFYREAGSGLRHCDPCIISGLDWRRAPLPQRPQAALDMIEDGRGKNPNPARRTHCVPGCNCGKHKRFATK